MTTVKLQCMSSSRCLSRRILAQDFLICRSVKLVRYLRLLKLKSVLIVLPPVHGDQLKTICVFGYLVVQGLLSLFGLYGRFVPDNEYTSYCDVVIGLA